MDIALCQAMYESHVYVGKGRTCAMLFLPLLDPVTRSRCTALLQCALLLWGRTGLTYLHLLYFSFFFPFPSSIRQRSHYILYNIPLHIATAIIHVKQVAALLVVVACWFARHINWYPDLVGLVILLVLLVSIGKLDATTPNPSASDADLGPGMEDHGASAVRYS